MSAVEFEDLDTLAPASFTDLASRPRWVAWREDMRDGKPAKRPYGQGRRLAKADDPATWGTHGEAKVWAADLVPRGGKGGVGLQLGDHAGLCIGGVDLDSCRDVETGEIAPWAAEIIRRFNAYSEISPSNTGLKIFFLYHRDDGETVKGLVTGKYGQTWSKGNHCEIALNMGNRYYALTRDNVNPQTFEDDVVGDFLEIPPVGLTDLEWLIQVAGPTFMGQQVTVPSARPAAGLPMKGREEGADKSRSGRAYAIACEIRRHRGTMDDFVKRLAREPDLAEWAKDDRQVIRAWKGTEGVVEEAFSLTEDGVARNFAAIYGDTLRYCAKLGGWLRWEGQRWRLEETQIAFHWARETCRARHADDPTEKGAKLLLRAASARAVETFARADPTFETVAGDWDRNQWLLGTPDGTVELRTGLLRPGLQGDLITKATAVGPIPLDRFDAERDCPTWLGFLGEALAGDADAIRFLQHWFGYTLSGSTNEQALVFIHGPGGSGKSTVADTMGDLLGDYCVTVDSATLSKSKHAQHTQELARLKGARMARSSETEQGRAWNQQRITSLTGGDTITARFMRENDFEFKPEFKLLIVGNHRPAIEEVDGAMRRRFHVLPFDNKPEKPDPTLRERLTAEWSGILSWAILGCLDWQRLVLQQKKGIVPPAVVKESTDEYFATQDVFQLWIDQCCETGNHVASTTDGLWQSWELFAMRSKEEPGSKQRTFPDRLRQRGFVPERNTAAVRGRGFRGIKVREDDLFDPTA